ncbi:MAG: phosphoribosyltransferase [Phycisphaerales bacterium]
MARAPTATPPALDPSPFPDRSEAGLRLAECLKAIPMVEPLVLAIPRGGLEVGLQVAQALGAELDVVLSRKLRAPDRTELAIGAVNESGDIHLNGNSHLVREAGAAWLERERRLQMTEIARQQDVFRKVRPKARPRHRTVIVVDDGVATGSTMLAALRMLRDCGTHELIAAAPVASTDATASVRAHCDRFVCLRETPDFWAVGQFYRRFEQVTDEHAADLLAAGQRRKPSASR